MENQISFLPLPRKFKKIPSQTCFTVNANGFLALFICIESKVHIQAKLGCNRIQRAAHVPIYNIYTTSKIRLLCPFMRYNVIFISLVCNFRPHVFTYLFSYKIRRFRQFDLKLDRIQQSYSYFLFKNESLKLLSSRFLHNVVLCTRHHRRKF